MMDSSLPGAVKSLAPTAIALAVAFASSPAHAQDPAEPAAPAPTTVAPSAPADTAAPAPAPTPPPAPAPAEAPAKPTAPAAGEGTETTPIPEVAKAEAQGAAHSWFERAPLTVSVGEGDQRWSLTFYGFVEADYIVDSTRSYSDSIGPTLVARDDTYAGKVGRSQFTMRNSRLGLKFGSPMIGGVKPSAVLEGDFFGPSSIDTSSENAVYTSPTFRVRHAYLQLQNDYVDVLAGQTYDVFGWQNYFFPMAVNFLGLPNQLFSRNEQFRLSHGFGTSGPVGVDIAAAAERPVQRDSGVPDLEAGLRLSVNDWKGITTPGNSGTTALPMSIGVSGTLRQFKVNAFTPPPTQNSNSATGWGLSVDALIPIIPADNANDRGNRLTLTGSFVTGTGIGDLINAMGGAEFPTLPNPAQANPAPEYSADIDNGLVSFDTQGVLHTIDWQTFRVGLQYYLPPSGRVVFSANYLQAHSANMAKLFPQGGAEIELLGHVADTSRYADVNLFWDATPAVRFGLSGAYTTVSYLDGDKPHNLRGMAMALYAF